MSILKCFNGFNCDLQSSVLNYFNPWKELFISEIVDEDLLLCAAWEKECKIIKDEKWQKIIRNYFMKQTLNFADTNMSHFPNQIITPDTIHLYKILAEDRYEIEVMIGNNVLISVSFLFNIGPREDYSRFQYSMGDRNCLFIPNFISDSDIMIMIDNDCRTAISIINLVKTNKLVLSSECNEPCDCYFGMSYLLYVIHPLEYIPDRSIMILKFDHMKLSGKDPNNSYYFNI